MVRKVRLGGQNRIGGRSLWAADTFGSDPNLGKTEHWYPVPWAHGGSPGIIGPCMWLDQKHGCLPVSATRVSRQAAGNYSTMGID